MNFKERLLKVPGWFKPGIIDAYDAIDEYQKSIGVSGDIGEIGCYCGRSFVCLASLCTGDEKAYAIDVFDRQEWNESRSGAGHVTNMSDIFDDTIEEFGVKDVTVKLAGRSNAVMRSGAVADDSFRIFRVDGGHTYHETMDDLQQAEEKLCAGGIVLIDDVFSPRWPSVATALNVVMFEDWRLKPLGIFLGEVILCRHEDREMMSTGLWKYLPKDTIIEWNGIPVALKMEK